jgi:hypothetical protein
MKITKWLYIPNNHRIFTIKQIVALQSFSEQNNYEHNRTQLFKKFYKMDKIQYWRGLCDARQVIGHPMTAL